jgi:hypothetical protein
MDRIPTAMEDLPQKDSHLPRHTNRALRTTQTTPQSPQPYLHERTCSSLYRHTRLLQAFLHSGLSWSNYLTTLHPIIRKFYLNMPPTHSDHLETSHHRPSTISSLGGYSNQHAADIPTSKSLKRYRTSDNSDSDPDRHNLGMTEPHHPIIPAS